VTPTETFRQARDLLLATRLDYECAYREFAWPRLERFNWALDWFDVIARGSSRVALHIVRLEGTDRRLTFDELRVASNRVANHLRALGLRRGERILLMMGNVEELWTTMLAGLKLGCPIVPASTLLTRADLVDRIERGEVRAVIAEPAFADRFAPLGAGLLRVLSEGRSIPGWRSLEDAAFASPDFNPQRPTQSSELALLYFTSGTTSKPKLVAHTHASYPIGHLSTMYWVGLQPGDVHLNLSSPGWAKHAWSCFFAPWSAEATVVTMQAARFDAQRVLEQLERCAVTSFCAPPTVWRAIVQEPLGDYRIVLREAVSAGEPLNAEIIARVQAAWGVTIRDGYGQTETTLQVGNFPGQPVKPGVMGRPAPGYVLELLDEQGMPAEEGEIALRLSDAPVGLTPGYLGDMQRNEAALAEGFYRTGDLAQRDAAGYLTYIGRNDEVFKSSDYRISPFELESVLLEHPWVLEAAVVPSADARRLSVPKACIVTARPAELDRDTALAIFRHIRERISPFKRIRRLEFRDLPKTISGKIRRADLRLAEADRLIDTRRAREFWEQDFSELAER
jgi:acetyl-CoA synthetase